MNPDKIRNVLNILFMILAVAAIITYFVALYADETVPYKEIVRILNIANQNKFKMVLATRSQK